MQSYSLYELNEYIRRVIALNFEQPIWVSAEISQMRDSRGNVYLELIQHDENSGLVIAQSSAVIWYKSYLFLKNKLKSLLPALLAEGTQVLVKVSVDFNERYGLKLIVVDIDPAYTIGQMEMTRRKILERLKSEDLLDKNKSLPLPIVIQKIAVISSETAAGYIDFMKQLSDNPYQYKFYTKLYHAAMQGKNVEPEVVEQLKNISDNGSYEAIVIIRGGGSRLDLSFFDNYNIAWRIANTKIPVISGIGHDIDESVTDLVAHTSLKTPTAVADFLIERLISFESEITQHGQKIRNMAAKTIHLHSLQISNYTQILSHKPREILLRQEEKILHQQSQLLQNAKTIILNQKRWLDQAKQILILSDPITIVKKGFSIIRKNGIIVTKTTQIKKGDQIEVHLKDGIQNAEIQ